MTNLPTKTIGIILAAGAASRMGQPKQLLPFRGESLVRRLILEMQLLDLQKLVVVTGAHAPVVTAALAGLPVETIYNPEWATGMGSSVAVGVQWAMEQQTDTAGVLITLVDQPLVEARHLEKLLAAATRHRAIAAAAYAGAMGVPAWFPASLFPELLDLKGQKGAKPLLTRHAGSVIPMDLPEAAFDIDTPEDYSLLLEKE